MPDDARDWLIAALASLTELQRRAVELVYLGRKTFRQVADVLGVSDLDVCAAIATAFHAISTACEAA